MNVASAEHDVRALIRVLIADDHRLMRKGLRLLLQTEPGIVVVGEAGDGAEAFRLAVQLRPNVVLADVDMPPPNGIELARQLRIAMPDAKTLIVSMHEDPVIVQSALSAGAAGYLVKSAAGSELVQAVRVVAAGQLYLDRYLRPSVHSPACSFPMTSRIIPG